MMPLLIPGEGPRAENDPLPGKAALPDTSPGFANLLAGLADQDSMTGTDGGIATPVVQPLLLSDPAPTLPPKSETAPESPDGSEPQGWAPLQASAFGADGLVGASTVPTTQDKAMGNVATPFQPPLPSPTSSARANITQSRPDAASRNTETPPSPSETGRSPGDILHASPSRMETGDARTFQPCFLADSWLSRIDDEPIPEAKTASTRRPSPGTGHDGGSTMVSVTLLPFDGGVGVTVTGPRLSSDAADLSLEARIAALLARHGRRAGPIAVNGQRAHPDTTSEDQ